MLTTHEAPAAATGTVYDIVARTTPLDTNLGAGVREAYADLYLAIKRRDIPRGSSIARELVLRVQDHTSAPQPGTVACFAVRIYSGRHVFALPFDGSRAGILEGLLDDLIPVSPPVEVTDGRGWLLAEGVLHEVCP
jgi:hypothetical protein